MRNLVAAIIYKAVMDWKFKGHRDEIRAFFKSEYGDGLCELIGYNADYVLEKLEKMEV